MLIKSQLGEDKRRFRLKEPSFPCLCFTISSLYCLSNDSIYTISYLDDENEWVTLASTEDLKEAHTISPKMIKILVIKCDINSNNQNNSSANSNQNNVNSNNNSSNSNNKKGVNIEDIALSILSNEKIVNNINTLLSSTLADYLPTIINTTIPYTIPILVSTISNMKKNGDHDPLNLDVPISSKEKRFSCSAEEKFLEPLKSSQNNIIGGIGITASLGMNNINNHSSILSQSLPLFSSVPNNSNNTSSPLASTTSIQPSAEVTVSSNQTNSSPLKDSTQEMPPPTQVPTAYRKSSSPIPFLFGSRNDNQVVPDSNVGFRPISPITELVTSQSTETSSPNRKRTTSLKTFFTSILSSSSSISNNNNNSASNTINSATTNLSNSNNIATVSEEPQTPKDIKSQDSQSNNPFINQPSLEQIVS